MSTHEIAIVEIGKIEPHPDPEVDRMELTRVWGWQCCIGKGQFKEGDKAVYIPPDYLVPLDDPSFAFLASNGKKQERIRVRRFKGAISQGLLIPVPGDMADLPVGTNVIERLGVERYEPPIPMRTGGNFTGGPRGLYVPKFDVESYQRYRNMFTPGEPIVATEKIHGASARFVYSQDINGEWKQFCGSRNNWMAEDDKCIWWQAFKQDTGIGGWCQRYPENILYGEVFGNVQSLKYGAKKNDIFFAAFGVLCKDKWVDFYDARWSVTDCGLRWVPVLYRGPFDEAMLLDLAEGESVWPGANHMREGVVIVPEYERRDEKLGRVCLKMVSNRYLEKSK